ncbi:MAG TPA: asparagine synthase-related protein [Steroidobacteraceae bacterium]|nr:asparagine synthase-related protein [Steroidobacteraceae bacterium]
MTGSAPRLFGVLAALGDARSPDLIAPDVHRAGSTVVAIAGSPYWSGGERAPAGRTAEAVAAAYRRSGKQFLERLHGSFALAIVDTQSRTALLAVDRMGIERITYRLLPGGLAFSTSAEALARLDGATPGVRAQGLYDFIFSHMVPGPQTIFENVMKLPPASCAHFADGKLTIEPYWRPEFVEHGGDERRLGEELHAALRDAVRACEPNGRTGAFLSGGLDSSTVAGVLGKVIDGPADTFSMGFGVDAYDELRYARIANQHFGARAHEYHVTPEDIVSMFDRIAAAYDEPFGNSSAVPTFYCAKVAGEHGMKRLLAGDGGDELFGGNERYAKQRVFEAYYTLPAWLRSGVIEPLARRVKPEHGIMPLRKFRSYVDQATVRLPARLETWNLVFLTRPEELLAPDFRAAIDPQAPLRQMQKIYDAAPGNSTLNKMLYYDWYYTLADNDLRKVGTMCELAGIEVLFPMLDTRVVELSNRVPPRLKMRGGELRSFYKRAMQGFLPNEILTKTKHGFGLPFGEWLKSHAQLGELIYGHLSDFKRRGIVRAQFIDELIERHRSGHASFYGYPIWDFAMLEAWLKSHLQPA